MRNRIVFDLVLLASVFCMPWWFIVIMGLVGAFLWGPYYELVGFGLIVDLLYGASSLPLSGVVGVITAALIIVIGSVARKVVRS